MIKRFLSIGAGAVALALVTSVLAISTASAQTPTPTATPAAVVDTEAEVTTSGIPPVVNAKWELPDMQCAVTGMQYAAGSGPTDLNLNTIPDADDAPLTPGMQMYPWLCDECNGVAQERQIEYWIAATDTSLSDISSVYADVWEPAVGQTDPVTGKCPDGRLPRDSGGVDMCFKYQVDLDEQPPTTDGFQPVACSVIGLYDDSHPPLVTWDVYAPLLAAVDTGQMTMAEAKDIVKLCYKHTKAVYRGTETLAHHQSAGMYEVYGIVEDLGGGTMEVLNYFEVLEIIGLRIDFTLVDWGTVQSNQIGWVDGDDVLDGPNSAHPTVKNCGNVPMGIGLHFSEMTKIAPVVDPSKVITDFDAKFMGEELDFVASVPQWFTMCAIPCHPQELDLSIHPTYKTGGAGVFEGTLDIWADICPFE